MSPTTPHLVCANLILGIFMSFTYHVLVLRLEMYVLMCGECIQTVQLALASPNLILKKFLNNHYGFLQVLIRRDHVGTEVKLHLQSL